jgi:asparagine synthase (glutamine-hydrolysing)
MCGIAGALALRPEAPPPPGAAELFAAAMVHRGPDGFGFWRRGPVALAHRRLSIIDLSEAGRQPMTNEDGQIAVVVNGEIYNHLALRADLEAKGHRFRSGSDSEVVLHLYEEVGMRVPELLRGMFAFALWDARSATLLLARDRFGEKPLHYCERPDGFVFASELAALIADERTPAALSLPALDAYLALQYVPAPDTIYRDVKKLPPGHTLEVRCGERPRLRRYYRAPVGPAAAGDGDAAAPALDEREAARRVRATVEEAVQSRLMSDVPLGAFLSGGVDSSVVVACMARATGRPVKTFSVGFAEGGRVDDELPYARLVAQRWETEHHELVVDPDMVGLLPSIVRHHGEPFADTSAVPTRYLSEMTRRHVTVALSGDAGDEAFGGYRRYVWAHVADMLGRLPGPLPRVVARALGAAPGGKARWLREYGAHLGAGEAERYLRFICHFSADEKRAIYAPELRAQLARDATAEAFAARLAASRATDTVGRLQDLDAETYLPDDILAKVDIASMTHGLEARAPLVDHAVMELGLSLPGRMKLRGGKGKRIFKEAFEDLVPTEILNRRKKGFALPTGRWLAGRLHGFARELLLSQNARARGLFDPAAVSDLLDRHRAGEDHGERLWNLMVLETWHHEMVDGRAAFAREVSTRADAIAREASGSGGIRATAAAAVVT